jgi:hypothetical protein
MLLQRGGALRDVGMGSLCARISGVIDIGPLRTEDRAAWEVLARGYKAFL